MKRNNKPQKEDSRQGGSRNSGPNSHSRLGGRNGQSRYTPVRMARERVGMTIEMAARKSRCTAAYIRQIENRSTSISWIMAQRLAQLYGCDCKLFLYDFTRTMPDQPGAEKDDYVGGGGRPKMTSVRPQLDRSDAKLKSAERQARTRKKPSGGTTKYKDN